MDSEHVTTLDRTGGRTVSPASTGIGCACLATVDPAPLQWGAVRGPVQELPFCETVALVESAQRGDRVAVEGLFARYLPLVRRMAALSLGKTKRELIDEDDVVQEALFEAFRRLDSFEVRSPGSFKYWVGSLVENKIRDRLRRERALKRGGGEVQRLGAFSTSARLESSLADDGPTPTQEARAAELEEQIDAALLQLGDEDRRIFQMRNLCGMEYGEIASLLGTKESSARAHYSRVLGKLSFLA